MATYYPQDEREEQWAIEMERKGIETLRRQAEQRATGTPETPVTNDTGDVRQVTERLRFYAEYGMTLLRDGGAAALAREAADALESLTAQPAPSGEIERLRYALADCRLLAGARVGPLADAIVKHVDDALGAHPAPSGWQQRIAAIAKDASERVAKNAGVAPQLCYAPILWALEDAMGQNAVDALPPEPEVKPNRFDCPTCGQGIAVDDEVCCRSCGADATPIVDGKPVWTPATDVEPQP
jgi:hypothetical protein